MKAFAVSILVAFFFTAQAQKEPFKFGTVPIKDLEMSVYDKDSSAEAVILADYGKSSINYNQSKGFQLSFERKIRIKIIRKEGLDWANFEIPLYNDGTGSEKASGIKGITYNLVDGKIIETKLSNDGKFREKRDEHFDVVKITLPDAREGSVIDFSYNILSDFLFNFQDWSFQSTIPTIRSEYYANIPEYFIYDKFMQGYVILSKVESTSSPKTISLSSFERSGGNVTSSSHETSTIAYTENNHKWIAENVPAFRREPFITTPKDYISRINFELATINFPNKPPQQIMGTWTEINKNYFEPLAKEINGNGFLKNTVEGLIANLEAPAEKIQAICNFVKDNIAWDGINRKMPSGNLKKVFDDKKGTSADINILLASMLDKAGISVSPVLLSTRDHGMIRESSAISSQFNYVLCLINLDQNTILLDATDRFLPTGMIPERCLNGKGFVLAKEGYQWIDLEAKTRTRSSITADLTLQDYSLVGKLKLDHLGYSAVEKRKDYYNKGEAGYVKDFLGSHEWECNKTEIQNAKDFHSNFVEIHDLTINETVTPAGDVVYVDPFVTHSLKMNPFKTEKREYPVNFGRQDEQVYQYRLTVPETLRVEEIPQNKIFTLPGNAGKYVYNAAVIGSTVSITSILSINKSLFSQDEYPVLREFYSRIVAKQAEQIVLKKK